MLVLVRGAVRSRSLAKDPSARPHTSTAALQSTHMHRGCLQNSVTNLRFPKMNSSNQCATSRWRARHRTRAAAGETPRHSSQQMTSAHLPPPPSPHTSQHAHMHVHTCLHPHPNTHADSSSPRLIPCHRAAHILLSTLQLLLQVSTAACPTRDVAPLSALRVQQPPSSGTFRLVSVVLLLVMVLVLVLVLLCSDSRFG